MKALQSAAMFAMMQAASGREERLVVFSQFSIGFVEFHL